MKRIPALLTIACICPVVLGAESGPKPNSAPGTEREDVFEFTEKPAVKRVGLDRYEITFAVKGYCDVTVAVMDARGRVARHLGSGVLGANAPAPFQKNSLKQTLYWTGKDDLEEYVKEPEKHSIRILLGLRPRFDRMLGGTSPKNLPGSVLGLALAEDGAYVFLKGQKDVFGHATLRKFDHGGNYLSTLMPPRADMPLEKLTGLGYVEYEPGKRAVQSAEIGNMVSGVGHFIPGTETGILNFRPVVAGGRIYYLNAGSSYGDGRVPSLLFYLGTDGSTDPSGLTGLPFSLQQHDGHSRSRLALSPDGRQIYMVGLAGSSELGQGNLPIVLRRAVDGQTRAVVFAGKARNDRHRFEVGSSNETFNNPVDVACDAVGRVYVSDHYNNRIQVLSPEGKWLKTIPVGGPGCLAVHRKTGAIYVLHIGELKGRSIPRLTKFASFDRPVEEFHIDHFSAEYFELDSWTAKPRLWVVGRQNDLSVAIWEEEGQGLGRILDFDEDAKKEAGENHFGRPRASVFDHVTGDPLRERLYLGGFRGNPLLFDLQTGKKGKQIRMPGAMNDFGFDKHGYMHCHMDPGCFAPGVARLDPSRAAMFVDGLGGKHPETEVYPEVPYDYGVPYEYRGSEVLRGILPVKDQPGAKYFQDGLGVTMMGEVAEECNISYIPKMEEEGFKTAFAGMWGKAATGAGSSREHLMNNVYPQYLRGIDERLKRGEEIYSLPRHPGAAVSGATLWTFDRNGELKKERAVVAGGVMAGVQVDEAGFLYFVTLRTRSPGGKAFLAGSGGTLGAAKSLFPHNANPTTSTLVKTKGVGAKFILSDAVIPPDPPPDRLPDLGGGRGAVWVEGAEWFYAGASPTKGESCTCASQRFHLDWFKRAYVPEAYRHAIGILDTNGNVILHLGRYGNFDDVLGMKAGTQDPALTLPRFISGTDNYLAFDDWGERWVVLKLDYHAQETVAIEDR